MLVKKGYQRTILLQKLFEFNVPTKDLVTIYILFIRSILEQSCVVWSSSITIEEKEDLERVQKVSLRMILKNRYKDYDNALNLAGLEKLSQRRVQLCLNFARKCVKNPKTSHMFPLNPTSHTMVNRETPRYFTQQVRTARLYKSAIPYLQKLLNKHC